VETAEADRVTEDKEISTEAETTVILTDEAAEIISGEDAKMTTSTNTGYTCFQCGKPSIVVGEQKEYVKGSLVISTQTICSDPECNERTNKVLKKEKDRRDQAMSQKNSLLAEKALQKAADAK
jgi:hypothetical protein